MCLRALHDALVKPMPEGPMTPCLATRWTESADGLTYDCELRQGVTFHNGDPLTAEDVQFRPTVSLEVVSLVARSCGYYRGQIEPRATP